MEGCQEAELGGTADQHCAYHPCGRRTFGAFGAHSTKKAEGVERSPVGLIGQYYLPVSASGTSPEVPDGKYPASGTFPVLCFLFFFMGFHFLVLLSSTATLPRNALASRCSLGFLWVFSGFSFGFLLFSSV